MKIRQSWLSKPQETPLSRCRHALLAYVCNISTDHIPSSPESEASQFKQPSHHQNPQQTNPVQQLQRSHPNQWKGAVNSHHCRCQQGRDLVSSGDYIEQLANRILFNLVEIGSQPGFLKMLPSLSKGPGIFFFRLDNDLDQLCEVFYERGSDKITQHTSI